MALGSTLRRICRKANYEIVAEPFVARARTDAETKGRLSWMVTHSPSGLERVHRLYSMMTEGLITPEVLTRKSVAFRDGFPILRNARATYSRAQTTEKQRLLIEGRLLGIKEDSTPDKLLAVMGHNVRTDILFNTSSKQLKQLLTDFADNKIPYDNVLAANQIRRVTPDSILDYQDSARIWSQLSDRHIDWLRSVRRAMDNARNQHKKNFTAQLKQAGVPEAEIPGRIEQQFGPDLAAYWPAHRYRMTVAYPDITAASTEPSLERYLSAERADIDKAFGVDLLDESLRDEIVELSRFIAQQGRKTPGFRFTDPKRVGLEDATYETADDAVAALFDLESKGLSEPLQDAFNETVQALGRIGRDPSRGTLVGTIQAIPERVAVRYYKRRLLSPQPLEPSSLRQFNAYMNSVLKATHFDPILPDLIRIGRTAARTDPLEADAFMSFVDGTLGTGGRVASPAMSEMGKFTGLLYGSTLIGNLSATLSNYLGQPGFILAEQGLMPTIVALRALAHKSGKFHPLFSFMEALNIGAESSLRAERRSGLLSNLLDDVSRSQSLGEAGRRFGRTGLDAADVFMASERRMQKTAYLAGMIRHLQDVGAWRPGMSAQQVDQGFKRFLATPGATDALRNAGENGIGTGSFLFGNINNPRLVRYIRQEPTGIGQIATMFANYPVQSFARVSMWAHDALRIRNRDSVLARQAAGKLFRFFSYGTIVAGPFFLWPVLRDMAASGDDTGAAMVKDFFVEWEKRFSFAGLIGQGIEAVSGEFEAPELAQKLSPFPNPTEPLGPIGQLGGGPGVQLATDIFSAFAPGRGFTNLQDPGRVEAREKLFGGFIEDVVSGIGDPARPLPSGGVSLLIPGGVALARLLNSALGTGLLTDAEDVQLDRFGRLVRPTTFSREIIRQFSRPLTEVLAAGEGRLSANEAEQRNFNIQRIRKSALEGNVVAVTDLLLEDPSLIESLQGDDLQRATMRGRLTRRGRAQLTKPRPLMMQDFRRAAARLDRGGLTPAEDFEAKEIFGISLMRLAKERAGRSAQGVPSLTQRARRITGR